jgi:hypothetical protein
LNYIRSIRLLDVTGRTVFRGGDHNTFLLLELPETARAALEADLRTMDIPADVIEHVDIDVSRLEP